MKTFAPFSRYHSSFAWAVLLSLVSAGLRAEDAQAPPDGTGGSAKKPGYEWHFSLGTSYTHNFNRPEDGRNALRVFDTEAGQPQFDVATLTFLRPAAPLGFQVDVVSGGDVPLFASQGDPIPEFANFKQAFLSWKPGGKSLEIRAGKFVTTAGYEVIADWSNLNPNFSNSFLFGYAIPFTHTGLRASLPVGKTTLVAGVNRGWDKVKDNNGAPSFELALTANPASWLTLVFDTHHGREQADSKSWRHLYDFVATAKLSAAWSLGVNADYATEANVPGVGDAAWWGWALYGTYAPRPTWSVALRIEQFDDPQGARTGTGQTLREADLTANWWVHPQLLLRLDLRRDLSTAAVFSTESAEQKARRQTTLALALVFKL